MKSYLYGALLGTLLLTGTSVAYADHSTHIEPADVPMVTSVHVEPVAVLATTSTCTIGHPLGVGSRGEAVKCLQMHLIEHGLLSTSATGYFGPLTKSAVQKWQAENGVPATGYFGTRSLAAFAAKDESAHTDTATPAAHGHASTDVASWPSVPSVRIVVHPDAMAGWNLEIQTENFAFAPAHASGAVVANEGHAHLMIDGKKLARVYGNWFHIPPEAIVGTGTHEVLVTLNANDHSGLVTDGAEIKAMQSVVIN